MFSEQLQVVAAPRTPGGRHTLRAAWYYVVAGGVHTLLLLISELGIVESAFLRLAWRLGWWPSFPMPYSQPSSFHFRHLMGDSVAILGAVSVETILISAAVAATHLTVFGVCVLAHRLFGRPSYWVDVRSRLRLLSAWSESARRSWWVWPVVQGVWLFLLVLSEAFQRAWCPMVDTGLPFLIGNLAVMCLLFSAFAHRAIRDRVISAVQPDDLRCRRCGSRLRGLTVQRCPECAYEGHVGGHVEYGLRRQREGHHRTARQWITALGAVLVLLAPAWFPSIIHRAPWSAPPFVPPGWVAHASLSHPSSEFPIRRDAVCVIRHDRGAAVIKMEEKSRRMQHYRVAFWFDEKDLRSGAAPAFIRNEEIAKPSYGDMPVGPWTLTCSTHADDMIWLQCPDSTYRVEAYAPDDVPKEYSSIDWDKASDEEGGR